MTSPRLAPACPTTIVVTGRTAPTSVVARCVQRLVTALPPEVSVVVATSRSTRLPPALARRVRSARGSQDDHLATIALEVTRDRAVLVLPASLVPSDPAWFGEAHERMAREPSLVGVVATEDDELLAFPRGVTDVGAPRTPWSPLPGLTAPAGRAGRSGSTAALRHRSLSAVLIVRDEEEVLEACLRAVAPFVDELVVYDTGSTDGSLAIASEHADVVVQGHWDDDFGAARNRALAHATRDWVLSIDADEVIEGSPAALRGIIDTTRTEGLLVSIVSTDHGRGRSGGTTRATRLFQREGASWVGVLHEQLAFGAGGRPAVVSTDHLPISLVHSGYSATTMTEKDKRTRNLELSRTAFEAAVPGTVERADGAAHYGRALAGAGRIDAALHVLGTLLEAPASPGNCLQAARIAIPELLRRRQWQSFDRWVDLADRSGESTGRVLTWKAGALIGHDRLDEAAALLDALVSSGEGSTDMWGHPFDPDDATTMRAELDLLRGAPELAADRMRGVLQCSPETVNLQVLVDSLGGIGLTMRDLIEEAPEEFLERALRDMVLLSPQVSLHWFAAQSAARPGDFRPLVAGNTVAARCGWLDALEWSTRAREAGLVGICALRDLAEEEERPLVDRALCWAFLAEGFGDADALPRLHALIATLDPEDQHPVRAVLRQHLPDLVLPAAPHDRTAV